MAAAICDNGLGHREAPPRSVVVGAGRGGPRDLTAAMGAAVSCCAAPDSRGAAPDATTLGPLNDACRSGMGPPRNAQWGPAAASAGHRGAPQAKLAAPDNAQRGAP